MAIDNKYGRVSLEHGDIGEDEPVVVFRGQDALLPKVLLYYHLFCAKAESPRAHLALIMNTREKIIRWQSYHLTRIPSSKKYFERIKDQ